MYFNIILAGAIHVLNPGVAKPRWGANSHMNEPRPRFNVKILYVELTLNKL